MQKLISGIHHVALKAGSVEKYRETLAFYRDLFGFELKRTWGEGEGAGAMLSFGDGCMELFAAGDETHGSVLRHIAFACTDVDLLVSRVRAAGYSILTEPKDIVIPSEPPLAARIAFCVGPCGEEIEFFCER